MKFNGEIWLTVPNRQKQIGEPDEFVLVKNAKSTGGLIPYARYGDDWTVTVPNRILIRELATALEDDRNKYADIP